MVLRRAGPWPPREDKEGYLPLPLPLPSPTIVTRKPPMSKPSAFPMFQTDLTKMLADFKISGVDRHHGYPKLQSHWGEWPDKAGPP